MSSTVKVGAVVALLIAGLVLLIFLAPAPPTPPVAPPAAAASPVADLAKDYADPDEDAVMEIEEMLLDFAWQMRRGAWADDLEQRRS